MELKNSKWTESTNRKEKLPNYFESMLQPSKKRKLLLGKSHSQQQKIINLTDYSCAEVRFVVDHILQREVKFSRFLGIFNSLENQLNGTVENDQETTSPISTLPNELLVKILSYLSTQDLRGNVAHVSKQFKELCKSPLVHQVVTVNAGENEADFLREATMMTELHIEANYGQDCQEELMAITKHCHLKALHVNGYVKLKPLCFYSLSLSKWWKNLNRFNFELEEYSYYEVVEHPSFSSVISILGCNENMIHFCFGSVIDCLDSYKLDVINLIKGPTMKHLKSLGVFEPCSDSQMLEIVEARKETLEELNIDCILSSYDFLTSCPKIKHLSISKTLCLELPIFPKLKNLTSLQIHVSENGDGYDLLKMLEDLPPVSLPSLTSLTFETDIISDMVKFLSMLS